jgi:hypothetical protein
LKSLDKYDFIWLANALKSNFNVNYFEKGSEAYDKISILFRKLQRKKVNSAALRKATDDFIENIQYKFWTVKEFLNFVPDNKAIDASPDFFKNLKVGDTFTDGGKEFYKLNSQMYQSTDPEDRTVKMWSKK